MLSVFCPEFPHHHFFGVRVKVFPCGALGTDIPFSVSSMICVSKLKIECNVKLSASVSGIIFLSAR